MSVTRSNPTKSGLYSSRGLPRPLRGPFAAHHVKSRRSRFAPVRRPGQDDDHGVIGITGLTDGIGRATARVLLADGTSSFSVMSLATRRDLTTSVDWPTKSAAARSRRGAQRGRLGADGKIVERSWLRAVT